MSPRAEATLRSAMLAVGGWMLAMVLGIGKAMSVGIAVPLISVLVLGALLGWAGRERVVLVATTLGAVMLYVVTFTPIVPAIGRQVMREDPPGPVDAVVVLGGGVTEHGLAESASVERLLAGLQRVPPGDTTPLVLSDVRSAPRSAIRSGNDLRRIVAAAGGRRILMQQDVFATRDEAEGVLRLARQRGWRRVGVITSVAHSRRACRTFEVVGLSVACWPAGERVVRIPDAASPAERLAAPPQVLYEVLGWLVYRVRGWV